MNENWVFKNTNLRLITKPETVKNNDRHKGRPASPWSGKRVKSLKIVDKFQFYLQKYQEYWKRTNDKKLLYEFLLGSSLAPFGFPYSWNRTSGKTQLKSKQILTTTKINFTRIFFSGTVNLVFHKNTGEGQRKIYHRKNLS